MLEKEAVRSSLLQLKTDLVSQYDQIKLRTNDLEQQISAIDVLLSKQFGDTVAMSSTDTQSEEVESHNKNDYEMANRDAKPLYVKSKVRNKSIRKGSVRDTARERFSELPSLFTKEDVANLVEKYHADLKGKSVNKNSLLGIMRDLVDRKLAKIKVKSAGTSPQIYEKLV